jgi:hypothetical protein
LLIIIVFSATNEDDILVPFYKEMELEEVKEQGKLMTFKDFTQSAEREYAKSPLRVSISNIDFTGLKMSLKDLNDICKRNKYSNRSYSVLNKYNCQTWIRETCTMVNLKKKS